MNHLFLQWLLVLFFGGSVVFAAENRPFIKCPSETFLPSDAPQELYQLEHSLERCSKAFIHKYLLCVTEERINTQSGLFKNTLLHKWITSDNYDLIRLLLSFGADPTIWNINGVTPIHSLIIAEKNQDKIIDTIQWCALVHGPQVYVACNVHEHTPLHTAAYAGKHKLVNFLLKQDIVNINRKDRYKYAAVQYAAMQNNFIVLQLFLNDQKLDFQSVLMVLYDAIEEGKINLINYILDFYDIPYDDLCDIFVKAMLHKKIEIALLLKNLILEKRSSIISNQDVV